MNAAPAGAGALPGSTAGLPDHAIAVDGSDRWRYFIVCISFG